jgi:soluble lytic murein transglycosylase-like protein
MHGKSTGRAALLAALLWGASASLAAAAPTAPPDPALKQRLIEAMAQGPGFKDRFEAEVWLTDMSHRLDTRIGDAHRRLELLRRVHREATRAELPPELVLAVIQVESNFDRYAISESGARGLMQIMPFWLKEIGHPEDNLFDPATNLRMGCTILRYYLDVEKGNLVRALARYNGSLGSDAYPARVFKALRRRWHR